MRTEATAAVIAKIRNVVAIRNNVEESTERRSKLR